MIVAGDDASICDRCVEVCNDILASRTFVTPLRSPAETTLQKIETRVAAAVPSQQSASRDLAAIFYNQHLRARAAAATIPAHGAPAPRLRTKTDSGNKSNAFVVGPAGCGKATAIHAAAEAADLPLAFVDAAAYTISRYIESDNPLTLLSDAAAQMETTAEFGILCVKNAHALLAPRWPDGSTRDAQMQLSPILTGDAKAGGHQFDTRNVLVVCSGIFESLNDERRTSTIFDPTPFRAIGFAPDFLAHFGTICRFAPLGSADLRSLLTRSCGVFAEYAQLFVPQGIDLRLTGEAADAIVSAAVARGTGARALRSVMENVAIAVSCTFAESPRSGLAEVDLPMVSRVLA